MHVSDETTGQSTAGRGGTRKRGAATFAALFLAGTLAGALTASPRPAQAQHLHEPQDRTAPNARALLRRMLQAEKERAYQAREITLIAGERQSEQIVKHDPKRGMRTEFIRPPGDLFVDNFRRSWFLSQRRLVVRESRAAELRRFAQDVVRRIGQGGLQARWVGQDIVAGRTADIVLVSPAPGVSAPSRRFWLDRETGLRLRTEEISPDGRVLSTSYFVSLDLTPTFPDSDFAAPQPPQGVERVVEDRQSFPSIDGAQRQVPFPIRRPAYLPPGFRLRLVRVIDFRGGKLVVQRYANGLNALSLFQTDAKTLPARIGKGPGAQGAAPPRGPRILPWRDGDLTFALIGNLSDEEMKRVADGVH